MITGTSDQEISDFHYRLRMNWRDSARHAHRLQCCLGRRATESALEMQSRDLSRLGRDIRAHFYYDQIDATWDDSIKFAVAYENWHRRKFPEAWLSPEMASVPSVMSTNIMDEIAKVQKGLWKAIHESFGVPAGLATSAISTPSPEEPARRKFRDWVNYVPRKGELPFSFGYELTALVGDYEEHKLVDGTSSSKTDEENQRISRLIGNAFLRKHWPRKYGKDQSYYDNHCMEFPSPVFTTRRDALKFYRGMKEQFDKHGCTAQNPATVCGGNHMHFGGLDNWTTKKIFRHFYSNPWITWTFTQPDDTDSCNNLLGDKEMFCIDLQVQMGMLKVSDKPLPDDGHPDYMGPSRTRIAQYKILKTADLLGDEDWRALTTKDEGLGVNSQATGRTLEFRGVEAPNNEAEFKDQMDFFFAYVNHFRKATKNPPKPVEFMSPDAFQRIPRKMAEEKFYEVCTEIGVDPKRYRKYVKRNLRTRWNQCNRKRT